MKKIKKALRSLQRQIEANVRNDKYQKNMDLHEEDDVGFDKLVHTQRNSRNKHTSSLIHDGNTYTTDTGVRSAWADYFEDLATPKEGNKHFVDNLLNNTESDIHNITEIFKEHRERKIETVNKKEVSELIASLKNGKSPDEDSLAADNLSMEVIHYIHVPS